MRNGMVLPELLIALIVTGLVALIAAPRVAAFADAAAVRSEALRVVTALDAARGAAVRLDAVASLTFDATGYRALVVVGADTVVAWRSAGPPGSVTVSGGGSPLLFGPAGLALGVSNRTITVAKGSASRRVVVSRLGRITY
jgi:prepilin-type N-terminal cleavage/methylation domain-containing protein